MVNNSQLAIKTNLPRSIKKLPHRSKLLRERYFKWMRQGRTARILSDPRGFIETKTLSCFRGLRLDFSISSCSSLQQITER